MLITRASEYALLSLIILAKASSPIDAQTLSCKLKISKSFLSKILQLLTKAEILKSFRGIKGGFVLKKDSNSITILNIIDAVEKKGASVFDCASSKDLCSSNQADICSLWPLLHKLQGKIDVFLNTLTIDDLIKEQE